MGGRKKVGQITYIQTFRDTNVVCIPSVENQECSITDLKSLMLARAQECAKNFMNSCDFGIREVLILNQNVNLDTFGSQKFGYELKPEMSQSGEENQEFAMIATANWGNSIAPRTLLLVVACLVCALLQ